MRLKTVIQPIKQYYSIFIPISLSLSFYLFFCFCQKKRECHIHTHKHKQWENREGRIFFKPFPLLRLKRYLSSLSLRFLLAVKINLWRNKFIAHFYLILYSTVFVAPLLGAVVCVRPDRSVRERESESFCVCI
jgi:hypothetical protein